MGNQKGLGVGFTLREQFQMECKNKSAAIPGRDRGARNFKQKNSPPPFLLWKDQRAPAFGYLYSFELFLFWKCTLLKTLTYLVGHFWITRFWYLFSKNGRLPQRPVKNTLIFKVNFQKIEVVVNLLFQKSYRAKLPRRFWCCKYGGIFRFRASPPTAVWPKNDLFLLSPW